MMGTGEGPPKAYAWAPTSPLGGRHSSSTQAQQQQNPKGQGNPYGPPLHSYSSVLASPSSGNHNLGYSGISSSHGSGGYAPAQMGGHGHSMAGLDMGHSNPQGQGGYYTSASMQTSPGAGGRAPLHRYTGPGAHAFTNGPYGGPAARNHQINFAMAMANGQQDREEPQQQQRPRGLSRSLVGEMNQVSTLLQHHGGEQLEREEEKQLLMMNEKRNHFKRSGEDSLVTFGGEANSWNGLDLSKMGLSLISKRLALYSHITCLFLNDNKLTTIPDIVFTLKKLNKLDLSNNQITKLPPALGRLVYLQELALSGNKIRELPCEMGKLFRLKVLHLDSNPITSPPPAILKQGVEATIGYLREKTPLPAPPPDRSWIPIKQVTNEHDSVRVLCYNVLAEKYAVPELLHYCPTRYLKYEHRKQQILKEMLSHSCDFIALQEVEAGHYKTFFEPQMSKMGYGGTFRPKSRARTMMDGSSVDGCVLFHKSDKYKMLEEFWIEYQSNSIKRYEKEFPGSVDALDRLMTKDQIAVATVFRCIPPSELKTGKPDPKEKERIVVVVNTHIHWDPEYPDVKLMQVCMLMEELEAITSNNKRYAGAPFLICGDFNSMPDSGVYKYIRDGKLEPNHADFHGFDYGRYTREGPRHPFHLSSAYESIGEPAFTNFTGNFTGCLDYIFYSSDKLEVCKILKPVDEDVVVSQTGALPNAYMCSDHIPLVSEFQFIKPGAKLGFADSAAGSGSWRRELNGLSSAATRHGDDEAEYDSEDEESDDASAGGAGSSRSGGGGGGSRGGSGVYAPWATHSSHSHSHRGSNGHDEYWANDSDSDNGRFY